MQKFLFHYSSSWEFGHDLKIEKSEKEDDTMIITDNKCIKEIDEKKMNLTVYLFSSSEIFGDSLTYLKKFQTKKQALEYCHQQYYLLNDEPPLYYDGISDEYYPGKIKKTENDDADEQHTDGIQFLILFISKDEFYTFGLQYRDTWHHFEFAKMLKLISFNFHQM